MNIETLTLYTPEPPRLADFYGATLGMPAQVTGEGALDVQAGQTRLTFRPTDGDTAPTYHFALNVPWTQFAAAKAWLAERAALARGPDGADEFDFPHWEARAIYFYDPAGNIGELIARRAIAPEVEGPFGPRGLLGVSEIGLATPDVPATVAGLKAAGLDVFRGSFGADFAAVGADSGLFIVVREGRPWFPDGRVKAGAWRLQVEARGRQGQRWTLSGPPYALTEVRGSGPNNAAGQA